MFNFSLFGTGSRSRLSYSYDPTTGSRKDSVRRLIGDKGQITDVEGDPVWILSDQDVEANLQEAGSYGEAVALCCDACITELAREPDVYKAGSSDAEAQWTERLEAWRALAFKARHGFINEPQDPSDASTRPTQPSFDLPGPRPGRDSRPLPDSGRIVDTQRRRR